MSKILKAFDSKGKQISLNKVKKALLPQFISQEKAIEALYYAYVTRNNVILYGEGGYGKSQLVKAFFKLINIQLNTLQCDISTTTDKLLGPINLKKWQEQSIYETNFESSLFIQPGVLLLEEFMDVPPSIASALKDVIQENGYRRGIEFIPSAITSIIITGNKAPEIVATTDSLKALYVDRFVYHINMTWETHTIEDYLDLLEYHFSDLSRDEPSMQIMGELCSEFKASPRIALEMVSLYKTGGFAAIKLLNIFQGSVANKIIAGIYEL